MDIFILFEDQTLIVINKPAGLTVNRSETAEYTLQDWMDNYLAFDTSDASDTSDTFHQRSGIVHRLDKETSGCLIIAKTSESFVELQRQFKNREVRKEYLALVHGQVEPEKGTINAPLARSRFNRQKFAVTPGGRISETSYQVLNHLFLCHPNLPAGGEGSSLPVGKTGASDINILSASLDSSSQTPQNDGTRKYFTLLRLFPKTGRTHQIRVHLQYFGHLIVADDKYAGENRIRQDRVWCPRLFLHAAKITFTHPDTKKIISIEAKLPKELKETLLFLQNSAVPGEDPESI